MSEFPALEELFNGRSYEEMKDRLNLKTIYPVQLCASCGRAHIDFDDMITCPYCGGI